MGRSRVAPLNPNTPTRSNTVKKEAPPCPLDVAPSEEGDKLEVAGIPLKSSQDAEPVPKLIGGPNSADSAPDSDRRVSKDVSHSGAAGATNGLALEAMLPSAGGASPPVPDGGMFSQQMQRLRARLQSVVQGVREVAQSLDEPHTLIANVRDQLQNRVEANVRRNSMSSVTPGYAGGPSLSRNSSLSRTSLGGLGSFKGIIPEGPDSETDFPAAPAFILDAPASPYESASGVGATPGSAGLSVRARVAAAERRSRSSGGLSEPLPLQLANVLPIVPEQASLAGAVDQLEPGEKATEADDGRATPQAVVHNADAAAVAVSHGSDSGNVSTEPALQQPAASSAKSNVAQAEVAVLSKEAGSSSFGVESRIPTGRRLGMTGGNSPETATAEAPGLDTADRFAADASMSVTASSQGGAVHGGLLAPQDPTTAVQLTDVPDTLRELWTLRARVRAQEDELASMVKQLSTKNAQLDQVQSTVQQKDKELGTITRRLSGVLGKLQNFQVTHHHQQQELHELHALQQLLQQQEPTPSTRASSAAAASRSPVDPPDSQFAPQAPSLTLAGARAQLLAGIPEGNGVMCYQATSSSAGRPSMTESALGEALQSRRSSVARRNSAGYPQRMLSLRDKGASLEVSLPPPPSMWGRGGTDGGDEEDYDVEAAENEDSIPEGDAEDKLAANLQHAQQVLSSSLSEQQAVSISVGARVTVAEAAAGLTTPFASPPDEVMSTAPSREVHSGSGEHTSSDNVTSSLQPPHVPTVGTAPATDVPVSTGSSSSNNDKVNTATSTAAATTVSRSVPAASGRDSSRSAAATRSAAGGRRRGPLGRLLQMAPSVACVLLLLRDPNIRQGLEQLRQSAAKDTTRRGSPSHRRVAAAGAAASSAPLDVSRYLPHAAADGNTDAFESQSSRECKAKWCSIIRPPSNPEDVYY